MKLHFLVNQVIPIFLSSHNIYSFQLILEGDFIERKYLDIDFKDLVGESHDTRVFGCKFTQGYKNNEFQGEKLVVKGMVQHNMREIENLRKVQASEFIVKYYGHSIVYHEGQNYFSIIMQRAQFSLEEYLRRKVEDPSSLRLIIPKKKILVDMTKGVEFLHRHNIIHRDLKPQNVLLFDDNPRAVIADLGSSKDNRGFDCCSHSIHHKATEVTLIFIINFKKF